MLITFLGIFFFFFTLVVSRGSWRNCKHKHVLVRGWYEFAHFYTIKIRMFLTFVRIFLQDLKQFSPIKFPGFLDFSNPSSKNPPPQLDQKNGQNLRNPTPSAFFKRNCPINPWTFDLFPLYHPSRSKHHRWHKLKVDSVEASPGQQRSDNESSCWRRERESERERQPIKPRVLEAE